jgi:hypothetical protein
MGLPEALTTQVPAMLRGVCIAPLPPGSLLPVTAVAGALGAGLALRCFYDIARPLPVGDEAEGGRRLLQWSLTLGLATLFVVGLQNLSAAGLAPPPDELGEWLRRALGAYGFLLAARAFVRFSAGLFPRPRALTPAIAEIDARAPREAEDILPPLPALERAEPANTIGGAGEVRTFLLGNVLFWLALAGWNTHSLCLFRLPA